MPHERIPYDSTQERVEDFSLITLYLQQISEFPLLAPEAELSLGEKINAGRDARVTLPNINNMQERTRLLGIAEAGRDAQEQLVQANLRFVVVIAKRYIGCGIELVDLIQEGNMGLMIAAEKFDHKLGKKFTTYAKWWIRQRMLRAIDEQSRTIALPVHVTDKIALVRRTQRELDQKLGRVSSIAEIAHALGVKEADIAILMQNTQPLVSLNYCVGGQRGGELGEFVKDKKTRLEEEVLDGEMVLFIHTALGKLPVDEKRVLELYGGFAGGKSLSFGQVAAEMGLPENRVKVLYANALRKLRHPAFGRGLRQFLQTEE